MSARVAVAPLRVDAPGTRAVVDEDKVLVAGRAAKGASVTVDGAAVTVGPDGAFETTVPLRGRRATTRSRCAAAAGALMPRTVHVAVTRVASLADAAKEFEQQKPLGYDAAMSDIAGKTGQPIVVDGDGARVARLGAPHARRSWTTSAGARSRRASRASSSGATCRSRTATCCARTASSARGFATPGGADRPRGRERVRRADAEAMRRRGVRRPPPGRRRAGRRRRRGRRRRPTCSGRGRSSWARRAGRAHRIASTGARAAGRARRCRGPRRGAARRVAGGARARSWT